MNKKIKHSYYNWENPVYSDFMIDILKSLEPRRYPENEIIYQELDEILEMTFMITGSFNVGYEINKVKKYKLHFNCGKNDDSTFGGFNTLFFKKSMFIYKCKNEIEGYAIRRK